VRNRSAYVSRACENRKDPNAKNMAQPGVGMLYAIDPFTGAPTAACGAGCAGGCGATAPGMYGGYGAYGAYGAQAMAACGGFSQSGGCFGTVGGRNDLQSLLAKYQPLLDADAMNALNRAGQAAASVLQMLDLKAGTVRNPSAYVVRAVANLGNEGGGAGMGPSGGGCGGGQMAGSSHLPLDEKAQATLQELPPEVSARIMSELEAKGAAIMNPSAYVSRAAANARRGEGAAASAFHAVAGGCGGMASPLCAGGTFDAAGFERTMERLDERARDAIMDLGRTDRQGAMSILQVLDEQGDKVQNPSAYVLRGVSNARKGHSGGCMGGMHQAAPSMRGFVGGMQASAGVVGGCGCGQFGGGCGEFGGCGFGGADLETLLVPWRSQLDDAAIKALEMISVQAAQHILSELEAKSGGIRNPSAYVCRAAKNEQQQSGGFVQQSSPYPMFGGGCGGGCGGLDSVSQADLQEEIARMGLSLDSKAIQALEEVGPSSALQIVRTLGMQGGKVQNPSAYITRAVANERRDRATAESMAKRPRIG